MITRAPRGELSLKDLSVFFFKTSQRRTELRGSRFAPSPGAPPRRAHSSAFSCATAPARCRRRQGKIEAEVEDERHAVVGFARLCRMVVCGEFVFFLAHLFWPSSLGEGGYTALEALAVAV